MYLPIRPFRIRPYSRQKQYCLAPELRTGSVSASASDLLYSSGENHLTSVFSTFSSWKMRGIPNLHCEGSVTMVWNASGERMQWKMPWSCSAADSPRSTFAMSCCIPCAEHSRSLFGSMEKKPFHVHSIQAVKDGANCKWVGNPIYLGSTKYFCHPVKLAWVFSWTLGGSPCFVLLSGKPCWNNVTGKEAIDERMVFLQTKKIKPLLLHSKSIWDN